MMLPTGSIIQKPYAYWSPENQKPIQVNNVEIVQFTHACEKALHPDCLTNLCNM